MTTDTERTAGRRPTDRPNPTDRPAPTDPPAGRRARPLLWTALVVAAGCNVAASIAGLNPVADIGSGLVVLACGITLATLRRRRR